MLHILLTILKIIGIILLVLLGILLTILLIVLFVPVRYRVKGSRDETDLTGTVRITWLFGVITFTASYVEKKTVSHLRLLGIDILKLRKRRRKNKKKKISKKEVSQKKKVSEETVSQNNNEDKLEKNADTKEITEVSDADSKKTKQPSGIYAKIKKIFEKILRFPAKIIDGIRKIKLTIKNIYDKISYWKEFLADDQNKAAIALVKDHLIKLLKHIFPKKINGQIVYGFEDPCTTGQVLAGVSIIYPVYYKSLSISPDFSRAVFEGNIDMKGRLYIAYLLRSVLMIYFNENIQYMIHTFRNKEEA